VNEKKFLSEKKFSLHLFNEVEPKHNKEEVGVLDNKAKCRCWSSRD